MAQAYVMQVYEEQGQRLQRERGPHTPEEEDVQRFLAAKIESFILSNPDTDWKASETTRRLTKYLDDSLTHKWNDFLCDSGYKTVSHCVAVEQKHQGISFSDTQAWDKTNDFRFSVAVNADNFYFLAQVYFVKGSDIFASSTESSTASDSSSDSEDVSSQASTSSTTSSSSSNSSSSSSSGSSSSSKSPKSRGDLIRSSQQKSKPLEG